MDDIELPEPDEDGFYLFPDESSICPPVRELPHAEELTDDRHPDKWLATGNPWTADAYDKNGIILRPSKH